MTTSVTNTPISFDQYVDIFFEVMENDDSEEAQLAALDARLKALGVTKEAQDELAREFIGAFHNPNPVNKLMNEMRDRGDL